MRLRVALGDGDKRTSLPDGINVKSFIGQALTKAHPKMGEESLKCFEFESLVGCHDIQHNDI